MKRWQIGTLLTAWAGLIMFTGYMLYIAGQADVRLHTQVMIFDARAGFSGPYYGQCLYRRAEAALLCAADARDQHVGLKLD